MHVTPASVGTALHARHVHDVHSSVDFAAMMMLQLKALRRTPEHKRSPLRRLPRAKKHSQLSKRPRAQASTYKRQSFTLGCITCAMAVKQLFAGQGHA